jgi:hypothetical protein
LGQQENGKLDDQRNPLMTRRGGGGGSVSPGREEKRKKEERKRDKKMKTEWIVLFPVWIVSFIFILESCSMYTITAYTINRSKNMYT